MLLETLRKVMRRQTQKDQIKIQRLDANLQCSQVVPASLPIESEAFRDQITSRDFLSCYVQNKL